MKPVEQVPLYAVQHGSLVLCLLLNLHNVRDQIIFILKKLQILHVSPGYAGVALRRGLGLFPVKLRLLLVHVDTLGFYFEGFLYFQKYFVV